MRCAAHHPLADDPPLLEAWLLPDTPDTALLDGSALEPGWLDPAALEEPAAELEDPAAEDAGALEEPAALEDAAAALEDPGALLLLPGLASEGSMPWGL